MRNQQHKYEINKNIRNKDHALKTFRDYMLAKTGQMFEYRNLPDSIPVYILEEFLQTNGNCFFYEHEGTLYVFTGGLGGEPDVYYQQTIYTIANPALNISINAKLNVDGVLMRNDTQMQGLLPLIYKYGVLLSEIDISVLMAIFATRDYNAISARTAKEKASAEEYIRQVESGNWNVIAEDPFFEGIKRHPTNTSSKTLADLRETYQYIKSLLYSDLGMKTAHNMKREYVSEEENIINDDTLLPLIDNMLECRKRGLAEVNKMFGTNIEVELKGTWKLQRDEVELAIEQLEGAVEIAESEGDGEIEESGVVEDDIAGEEGEEEVEIEDTESPETNKETIEEDNGEQHVEVNIELNLNGEDEEHVVPETEEESDDQKQP